MEINFCIFFFLKHLVTRLTRIFCSKFIRSVDFGVWCHCKFYKFYFVFFFSIFCEFYREVFFFFFLKHKRTKRSLVTCPTSPSWMSGYSIIVNFEIVLLFVMIYLGKILHRIYLLFSFHKIVPDGQGLEQQIWIPSYRAHRRSKICRSTG